MRAKAVTPIRVLQVIAGLDPTIGGPPVSAVETSLALREQGLVNELAFVFDRTLDASPTVALLHERGIVNHGFPMAQSLGRLGPRWGYSPRLAWWLLRSARRYDVLHMHGAWTFTTVFGLLCARLTNRIAVLSTHESLTDFDRAESSLLGRLVKRALRAFYLWAFSTVVVSSALEQRDSGDPAGRRSIVVPHAVRHLADASSLSMHRRRAPLAVGFLGRLHPKKNLDIVIESLARLDGNVVLRVAGDGPERDRLLGFARDFQVDQRITWLGFVQTSEKAEFLRSIDVLAMPSAYECFGVAAIEAVGAGVPVIVSPTVGVAEFVGRHKCGLIVDPDVDSLADALTQLVLHPSVLDRLQGGGKAPARAEFSRERHGKRLHAEYLRLLRRPLARATAQPLGELP